VRKGAHLRAVRTTFVGMVGTALDGTALTQKPSGAFAHPTSPYRLQPGEHCAAASSHRLHIQLTQTCAAIAEGYGGVKSAIAVLVIK